MTPIYPDIDVALSDQDGNAFVIIGRISGALKRGGVPRDKVIEFQKEAQSGDYDNVLRTVMKWVNVT